MDVVDLGMADHGGLQADGVGYRGPRQQRAERAAFGGAAAGDRGDQRVGHVPALHGALGFRQRRDGRARDEGGQIPNDAHGRSGAGERWSSSEPLAVIAIMAEITAPPLAGSCAPTCRE